MKLGDTFEYKGKTYRLAKADNHIACNGCAFEEEDCSDIPDEYPCYTGCMDEDDGSMVVLLGSADNLIFKEVHSMECNDMNDYSKTLESIAKRRGH